MEWRKIAVKVFKLLVIGGSILFIVNRLWIEYKSEIFLNMFHYLNGTSLLLFALALLLVFANWVVEAFKWKFLVLPLQNISVTQAIKSVFAGISVSIFTPNRVGEFGGRILFIHEQVRVQGIIATLVGNIAQTIITLIAGILFFPFLFQNTSFSVGVNEKYLFVAAMIMVLLGFLFFFNIRKVAKIILNISWFSKNQSFVNFLLKYSQIELLRCFLLSALRYLVFTFQFFLLLQVFGVHLSYFVALIAISQVYFIMTFIPTFALAELGIRGSVAILVIGYFSPFTSSIMAASIMLWVINLAIPALIGTLFIYKVKN